MQQLEEASYCPLHRIEEQEKEAKKFGFYWESFQQIIDQILSECVEVQEAWKTGDSAHLQEEIGDLIQATLALAIFCDFNPRQILFNSIEKFQKRYDAVVRMSLADGLHTLHQQPLEVLMNYWNRAKIEKILS